MGTFKALVLDGYHACFYKQMWPHIQEEVPNIFKVFHINDTFCRKLNHTNTVLIPKIKHPTKHEHFRPISLTNVIYRLLAKILVNRLRPMISKVIGSHQIAFVPGRSIHENALLAKCQTFWEQPPLYSAV